MIDPIAHLDQTPKMMELLILRPKQDLDSVQSSDYSSFSFELDAKKASLLDFNFREKASGNNPNGEKMAGSALDKNLANIETSSNEGANLTVSEI